MAAMKKSKNPKNVFRNKEVTVTATAKTEEDDWATYKAKKRREMAERMEKEGITYEQADAAFLDMFDLNDLPPLDGD